MQDSSYMIFLDLTWYQCLPDPISTSCHVYHRLLEWNRRSGISLICPTPIWSRPSHLRHQSPQPLTTNLVLPLVCWSNTPLFFTSWCTDCYTIYSAHHNWSLLPVFSPSPVFLCRLHCFAEALHLLYSLLQSHLPVEISPSPCSPCLHHLYRCTLSGTRVIIVIDL